MFAGNHWRKLQFCGYLQFYRKFRKISFTHHFQNFLKLGRLLDSVISTWLSSERLVMNLFPIWTTARSFGMMTLYSHVISATTLRKNLLALLPNC